MFYPKPHLERRQAVFHSLRLDMAKTELYIHLPVQGPKCYILLEWACCLLVAIAMSSVIGNHRFVRWICSPH